MKKLFSVLLLLMVATTSVFAQGTKHKPKPNSERKSPHDTITANNIKIRYGRPYKKGREIFGELESYGKVWRAGADEATEITFDKDCTFGDKKLKAGTYTLFATPNKTDWTIILNGKLGQWGAFEYDKNKDQNVLQTSVPVKNLDAAVEQLTMTIKKNGLRIEWDKTSVFVPIKF